MPSISCPQCGMTSHHPEDVKNEYCGNCHNWHDLMICPCGRNLVGHYSSPQARARVAALVGLLGLLIDVTSEGVTYRVNRHYIALHGVSSDELPNLATHGVIERVGEAP